jgi:cytochrome c-type biogenesis protein CcmH/NrfG
VRASLPHYHQAVRVDPRNADAWIGGARALIRLKEYEKARAWLSEARRVHPDRRELADLWALLPISSRRG